MPQITKRNQPIDRNRIWQNIYFRGNKVRTDLIYNDPSSRKGYRIRGVTGAAISEEEIRRRLARGELQLNTGVNESEFSPRLSQEIATGQIRGRLEQQKIQEAKKYGVPLRKLDQELARRERLKETARRQIIESRPKRATTRQEFISGLLRKQGYTVGISKGGRILAKKKNMQVFITKDGRTVQAPSSAVIRERFVPTRQQQREAEKRQQEKTSAPLTKTQVIKRLLEKQGYKVGVDQNNNVLAVKGDRKVFITFDGRTVSAPKDAIIRKNFIPTVKQQREAKERERLIRERWKERAKGFVEFPVSIIKGYENIYRSLILGKSYKKEGLNFIAQALETRKKLIRLKNKKIVTNADRKAAQKTLIEYNEAKKKFRTTNETIDKFIKSEDAKLARDITALGILGTGAAAAGGLYAVAGNLGLGAIGTYATVSQALETIKNPTPRNQGKLIFFAIPTAISILRGIRKLSPNFRPSVKNVPIIKNQIAKELVRLKGLYRNAKKGKIIYKGNKRLSKARALKDLARRIRLAKQAIKELSWIQRNPEIIKTRDFNPRVHTKFLSKLQGSYKQGIHVSTEKNINKLFGNEGKAKFISKQKLFQKIPQKELLSQAKTKTLPKVGLPFSLRRTVTNYLLRYIKSSKQVLTGAYAQNLYVGKKYRRYTGDLDIKSLTPRRTASRIAKILKRKFPDLKINIRKLPKAFRVEVQGKGIIDIAKLERGTKIKRILGFRVVSKRFLIRRKLLAAKIRAFKKGPKDIKDIVRLTGGKVKAKDVLSSKKNPSNVFEVARQVNGMGKSRLKFSETHLYFDFEAAIAYSYGKPYSIIKFPYSKISKFPPRLNAMIKKAANNELSLRQSMALRKALNRYIKLHPGKFFIGPRTASLPIGEREFVLAEGSKFIAGQQYKTFDPDLQRFVSIIEVAFKKPRKLSLFKRFVEGWKRKPFTTLRLRLSNPDILLVRRYTKLVSKDYGLSPRQKLTFLQLMKKMFKSKKGRLLRPTKKKKKVQRIEAKLKKEIRSRRIKRLAARRRKIKLLKRRKAAPKRKPSKRTVIRKPVRRIVSRKPTRRTISRKPTKRKPTKRQPVKRTRIKRTPTKRTTVRKPTKRQPVKRTPTRRPRIRIPVRTPRKRTPPTVRVPRKTTEKKTYVGIPTWRSKIKRGFVPLVNILVRSRGKIREIKVNLTPNRAIRRARQLIDRRLIRSFQLKIVGVRQGKDIPKQSLLKFRIRKGTNPRVLVFVEKTKYALDTKGEIRAIQAARRAKRRKNAKKKKIAR